ncbi:hypothetical protein [Tolypothrix sp. PCC 7910]|nr:hypothetical protein [Tolypothrix sp. PCC 7910]
MSFYSSAPLLPYPPDLVAIQLWTFLIFSSKVRLVDGIAVQP